ncbi:hypothetical protein NKH77_09740 [Streptomyces sp. M19]
MDSTPSATPAPDASRFPRQFARTRRFALGAPRLFRVSHDGDRVLFARTGGGSDPLSELWLYEPGIGERLLADPGGCPATARCPPEQARRERAGAGRGCGGVRGRQRAAHRGVRARRALWAVRTDGGDPFPVTAAGPVTDPRPSRTGG